MNVETTRMSSRGQIVIPLDIREDMGINEGSVFAVVGREDTIVLKKIEMPSRDKLISELKAIAVEGKRRLQKSGVKESDIPGIVARARKK